MSALKKPSYTSSPSQSVNPSFTARDLQRLHRRATQLIKSAAAPQSSRFTSTTTTSAALAHTSSSSSSSYTRQRHPLTPPSSSHPTTAHPTETPASRRTLPPTTAVMTSLQQVIDAMRDSMQQSLLERKRIHADALELAEAESRDLYDSVIAAQTRATTAEDQLERAKLKLNEYRDSTATKFSNELSELKQDWSNQMSASVMQSELRAALAKTKSIAEEQAIRLQVLTEERSRMIQESTNQRRAREETTAKHTKQLAQLHQHHTEEKNKLEGKLTQVETTLSAKQTKCEELQAIKNKIEVQLNQSENECHQTKDQLKIVTGQKNQIDLDLKHEKHRADQAERELNTTTVSLNQRIQQMSVKEKEVSLSLSHTESRLEEIQNER